MANLLENNIESKNCLGKYNHENSVKLSLIKVYNLTTSEITDDVVSEFPLGLIVNGQYFNTFLCSPFNLKELIVGYLSFKNLINNKDDILDFKIDNDSRMAHITIKETHPEQNKNTIYLNEYDFINAKPVNSDLKISASKIYNYMDSNLSSKLFKNTAGVHNISIYDKNELIISCEDVARHNAIDKAIGYCILNNISLDDKVLLVSGRLSFEMIQKVACVSIPIVIAKSATTNLAIELAEKLNITLVGFVRDKKMNIYTNSNRIIFE